MTKGRAILPRCGIGIFWLSTLAALYVVGRYKDLPSHSLADGVSMVIAASDFAIIRNVRSPL